MKEGRLWGSPGAIWEGEVEDPSSFLGAVTVQTQSQDLVLKMSSLVEEEKEKLSSLPPSPSI